MLRNFTPSKGYHAYPSLRDLALIDKFQELALKKQHSGLDQALLPCNNVNLLNNEQSAVTQLAFKRKTEAVDFLINEYHGLPSLAVLGYAMGNHQQEVNRLLKGAANPSQFKDFCNKAIRGHARMGHISEIYELLASIEDAATRLSLQYCAIYYLLVSGYDSVATLLFHQAGGLLKLEHALIIGYAERGMFPQVSDHINRHMNTETQRTLTASAVYGRALSSDIHEVLQTINRETNETYKQQLRKRAVDGFAYIGNLEAAHIIIRNEPQDYKRRELFYSIITILSRHNHYELMLEQIELTTPNHRAHAKIAAINGLVNTYPLPIINKMIDSASSDSERMELRIASANLLAAHGMIGTIFAYVDSMSTIYEKTILLHNAIEGAIRAQPITALDVILHYAKDNQELYNSVSEIAIRKLARVGDEFHVQKILWAEKITKRHEILSLAAVSGYAWGKHYQLVNDLIKNERDQETKIKLVNAALDAYKDSKQLPKELCYGGSLTMAFSENLLAPLDELISSRQQQTSRPLSHSAPDFTEAKSARKRWHVDTLSLLPPKKKYCAERQLLTQQAVLALQRYGLNNRSMPVIKMEGVEPALSRLMKK